MAVILQIGHVQTRKARAALNKLRLKQIPFVIALATTKTAIRARNAIRRQTRKEFNLHTEFIPRGIRATIAKASSVRATGRAYADVHTAPIISGFMPIHEEGGERMPHKRALAVPGSTLQSMSYKTATGRVRKRLRPRTLLQDLKGKGRFVQHGGVSVRVASGSRRGKAFIIHTRSNTPMIVRRKSSSRFPLQFLYHFEKQVSIKPIWGFEKTVKHVAHSTYRRNMEAALIKAIQPKGRK